MREIRSVCQAACIDDYIMSLPEGYETMLGEGGVILSGGQRQRLAIARALLKKTEVILFDEATSALDNETQEQIQQAIGNLQGEYTILIVAHRLSTVIDSDRIFVVDKGKIVADGTHQELLRSCQFYHDLYRKDLV
ncbi:ATP-binding cassette domain-containing protein, partial [Candidatus Saccharibacteria bacterium]|nr:ATP-binding cassette domain-containing protein [Candidatus Saccharibacteria bacterium]